MHVSWDVARRCPAAIRFIAVLALSLVRDCVSVQTLKKDEAVHRPAQQASRLPLVNETLSLVEFGKVHRERAARGLQPWGKVHRVGPAQRPNARKHPEVWEARISSGPILPGSPLASLIGATPQAPSPQAPSPQAPSHTLTDAPLAASSSATALAVSAAANLKHMHGLRAAASTHRAQTANDFGKVSPPPGSMKEYCKTPGPQPDGPCPYVVEDEVLVNWEGKGHWYAAKITDHMNNDTHELYSVIYHDGRMEVGLNCSRLSKGSKAGHFHTKEWVEAMWSGYEKWYTARVTAANKDGTYNLIYKDDGMLEDNVPLDRIRKIENAESAKTKPQKEDPVCKMVGTFGDLEDSLNGAHGKVAQAIQGPDGSIMKLQNMGPPQFSGAGDLELEGYFIDGPAPAPAGGATMDRKKNWLKNHLTKAAQRLTDKYGNLEAAFKAGDTNGDGVLSLPELTALLEGLGIPAATAKALAEATLHKFGPQGAPIADAAAHMQMLIDDESALDEAVEDMMASGKPPLFPDNINTGDTEAMKAQVQKMRAELYGRTSELVERYGAMGQWPPELKKLKEQDEKRMLSPLPMTEEELQNEIDWLNGEIWDRAHRLDEELQYESDPDMLAGNSKHLMDGLESDVNKINGLSASLEDEVLRLEREGKLDPELAKEMKKLLGDADHLKKDWKDAKGGKGDNGIRNTGMFGVNLELLNQDLMAMTGSLQGLSTGVLPLGQKWWRYRWEYSFVEAWIIILLCLLASFWTKIYNLVRQRLGREMLDTPLFVEEYLPHVALATWLRYFMAVLVVLQLVVISLWVLARLGLFELWIAIEYHVVEGINLPVEGKVYVQLAWDVASQLSVAMILFYLLTLLICFRALRNDRDCKNLEECESDEQLPGPVSTVMIGKFAQTVDEYRSLKQGWFEAIAHRCSELTPRGARTEAQKLRYVLEQRGVMSPEHQHNFPLWYFISQRVRKGVEKTFMIDSIIWLLFAFVFWIFSLLHYFAQIAYIRISIGLCIISLLGSIWMICTVQKMSSVHDDSLMIRVTPMMVVCMFQFPLFFLCFVATRLMLSTYLWSLFTGLSCIVLVMVVSFFILFCLVIAPLVIRFLIKTSFPPHTNDAVALIESTLDEYELAAKREEIKKKTKYEMWNAQTAPAPIGTSGPYGAPCGVFRPCPDSSQVVSPQGRDRSPTMGSMYPGGPGGALGGYGGGMKTQQFAPQDSWGGAPPMPPPQDSGYRHGAPMQSMQSDPYHPANSHTF